jgi:D-alanyl-D-alanine carboxypeptidase/D-alanyl-D-alanine-endopeptidase (penicillin-binding protein 4)
LIVPRDAPFGFLREGGDAWLDRVALKTGSMDEPHSVLGIAGYLRKRNGGWIAFAAIVNGGPTRPHVPLRDALGAARADIEALLAKY